MARSIAADSTEAWRAVLIMSNPNGEGIAETYTVYEGIYNTEAAAKGRVTYWRNWTKYKLDNDRNHGEFLVKGWVEKATLEWATPSE